MGFRYIGSKAKILDGITHQITKDAPGAHTICDLMCGTGCVSSALRKVGYRVIANDMMTFSYHHARVLLLFDGPPSFAGAQGFISEYCPPNTTLIERTPYQAIIAALNNLPRKNGYFFEEFSLSGKPKLTDNARQYFTPENAGKIDAIRLCIKQLHADGHISDLEHSLLIHDLIMATNDVANIAGTYGHYMSKFVARAKQKIELTPSVLDYFEDNGSIVTRRLAEDVASAIACDICYIDPPYMKRQYSANYHILETIAREDEPDAAGVSGLRPWRDQYSNFCTKTRFEQSLDKIITSMDCGRFVISYSEDGLIPIGSLAKMLSAYGKVRVETFKHKRFKSNNSSLAPKLNEYVLHLIK